MPTYRTYDANGSDLGEIRLADVLITPGDEIPLGPGRKLRVLEVVAIMEPESPYAALLKVEPVVDLQKVVDNVRPSLDYLADK